MNKVKLPAAGLFVIANVCAGSAAHANGVQAGTVITNTASATYSSGASTTTITSNTVSIKVDELLDVAVASLDSAAKPVGNGNAVLTFQVTNTGNGAESFTVTADGAVAGNAFALDLQTVAIDYNGNGTYEPGVDSVIPNGGTSGEIPADGKITVFLIVSAPAGVSDGATSQIRLNAIAVTGTGSPGTAFTGKGDGGGDAIVGASTAQAGSIGSTIASIASVSLLKSMSIVDPFGGSRPVPGAVVSYSIQASVSGSGDASGLHVIDTIPVGTTYQSGSLKLDGAALSDAIDGDAGKASSAGIDVDLGNLPAGATRTVRFSATIN